VDNFYEFNMDNQTYGMVMASILIVEDHKLLAEVLATTLERKGKFNVTKVVHTAMDAIEELPSLNVDIALVDLSLPKMNGIDLVAFIHENYPELPCLMMSAHTAHHSIRRALVAGARGYIVKDDINELIDGVNHVLRGGVYMSKMLREEGLQNSSSGSDEFQDS
jgi:DNA-binding NarL/FixJ family response regulator